MACFKGATPMNNSGVTRRDFVKTVGATVISIGLVGRAGAQLAQGNGGPQLTHLSATKLAQVIMPRHACNKARDSPPLLPDCELSRHNPGSGIMDKGMFISNDTRAFPYRTTTISWWSAAMWSAMRCGPDWFPARRTGGGARCGAGCRPLSRCPTCFLLGPGCGFRTGWNGLTLP